MKVKGQNDLPAARRAHIGRVEIYAQHLHDTIRTGPPTVYAFRAQRVAEFLKIYPNPAEASQADPASWLLISAYADPGQSLFDTARSLAQLDAVWEAGAARIERARLDALRAVGAAKSPEEVAEIDPDWPADIMSFAAKPWSAFRRVTFGPKL